MHLNDPGPCADRADSRGDRMRALRLVLALGSLAALTACVTPDRAPSAEPPHGVTLATAGGSGPARGVQKVTVPLNVVGVEVTVPRDLRVSEAEVFYPIADIVWRGDPRGDRYAQVQAIYDRAVAAAIPPLNHGLPVVAEIVVTRFHCVTDKTRYTFGGVHSLTFTLTIRDAASGAVLSGPRKVKADVAAHGGQKAIADDMAGLTQKQIVTERLASVIRGELKQLNVDPGLLGLPAQGLMNPAIPVLN